MNRTDALAQADALINGPRAEDYGSFQDQMYSISSMMKGLDVEITPKQCALFMCCLKLKRLTTSPDIDSVLDLLGYGALIAEHFYAKEEDDHADAFDHLGPDVLSGVPEPRRFEPGIVWGTPGDSPEQGC
jgi:hypothetical protein